MIEIANYKEYSIDSKLRSKIVSWGEYQNKIVELANKIDKDYQCVLGIFQGGYIVAMSLADFFIDSRVGGIISSAETNGKMIILTDNPNSNLDDLKDRSVLLVDEVVESGYSIKKCKDILRMLCVSKIDTACMYYNVSSKEKIDYYVECFDEDVNYIFPWRNHRDCGSLLMDVMRQGILYSAEELEVRLKDMFDVGIHNEAIENFLKKNEEVFIKKGKKWKIKDER